MQFFITEAPDDKINEKLNSLFLFALKILEKKLPQHFKKLSDSNSLQVYFISDSEIQELNNAHRGKDSPTDVLSWGYINEYLMPHEDAGEIYISTETAARKATLKQVSIDEEYMFLFVHGLLHVFDFDHNNDAEEDEMNQVTAEILSQYGVDIEPHI